MLQLPRVPQESCKQGDVTLLASFGAFLFGLDCHTASAVERFKSIRGRIAPLWLYAPDEEASRQGHRSIAETQASRAAKATRGAN